MHSSKTCFLNVGLGQWYCHGTDRLKGSLLHHGFPGDILTWQDEWPSSKFPRDCVYNVKADAFEQALKRGYEVIIWGDCSIYALKNTTPFVDRIIADGYWIGQSGYNAAQTASDMQLNYFSITRDRAAEIHDCATGLFGFDVRRPEMLAIVEEWIEAGRNGIFNGPRNHGGGSQDRRFLHARQDQSAMSLVLGKHRVGLREFKEFGKFKWDRYDSIFHCQGM